MKPVEPSGAPADAGDVHKVSIENIENFKEQDTTSGDYAGAAAKTDPVEIALVRKLDWRIMVSRVTSLSCLNTADSHESPHCASCTF